MTTNTNTNTDKILKTMFARLLQLDVESEMVTKLCAVIDSVTDRVEIGRASCRERV